MRRFDFLCKFIWTTEIDTYWVSLVGLNNTM